MRDKKLGGVKLYARTGKNIDGTMLKRQVSSGKINSPGMIDGEVIWLNKN